MLPPRILGGQTKLIILFCKQNLTFKNTIILAGADRRVITRAENTSNRPQILRASYTVIMLPFF